ncbi:CLUMA_CG012056, isoform A [Clunio marinus]|uniref:CLUMA_CG012056, isoform A n=1 Tax=Clunio marinus TaxID=568069 RepID=A0A1J1IFC7_9DIPT|nr:CLUMA_CG012056, isoform A [Clunio marinus]
MKNGVLARLMLGKYAQRTNNRIISSLNKIIDKYVEQREVCRDYVTKYQLFPLTNIIEYFIITFSVALRVYDYGEIRMKSMQIFIKYMYFSFPWWHANKEDLTNGV